MMNQSVDLCEYALGAKNDSKDAAMNWMFDDLAAVQSGFAAQRSMRVNSDSTVSTKLTMSAPQPRLAVAVLMSGTAPDTRSAAEIEARKTQARELASMMNQSVELCECVEFQT